jgi:hypothetical protein
MEKKNDEPPKKRTSCATTTALLRVAAWIALGTLVLLLATTTVQICTRAHRWVGRKPIRARDVKTGDLLLMRSSTKNTVRRAGSVFFSGCMQTVLLHPVHHVGIAYVEPDTNRLLSWEMRAGKVNLYPMKPERENWQIWVRPLSKSLPEGTFEQAMRSLRERGEPTVNWTCVPDWMVKRWFGYRDDAEKQVPHPLDASDKRVCSSFLADTLEALGVLRSNGTSPSRCFPPDYAAEPWDDALMPLNRGYAYGNAQPLQWRGNK